jgi:Zn-finger protein
MKERGMQADWEGKAYSFFRNKDCEYFPCHEGADPENFNCLFCFCPLYFLGKNCGGDFRYTENGVKDCSGCLFPHKRENYGQVVEKLRRFIEATRRKEE